MRFLKNVPPVFGLEISRFARSTVSNPIVRSLTKLHWIDPLKERLCFLNSYRNLQFERVLSLQR